MSKELYEALKKIKNRNSAFVDEVMDEHNNRLPSDGDLDRYNDWQDASQALSAYEAQAKTEEELVRIEEIEKILEPAIDCKAPYAKFIIKKLDDLVEIEIIRALRDCGAPNVKGGVTK